MTSDSLRMARMPVLVTFALLAALFAASVGLDEAASGSGVRITILALAALKVALIASEYVEVRGSAHWLVIVWAVWGAATFAGLAVLGA